MNDLEGFAVAWKDLGKYPEKDVAFHEQRLEIARKAGDRKSEGEALGSIGKVWSQAGYAQKAIEFFEQRLDIARELGDRRGEGIAHSNLGLSWKSLRNTDKAISYYEQDRVISHEIGDRASEAITNFNLAVVLYEVGQKVEAVPRAEMALAYFKSIDHENFILTISLTLATWRGTAT